MNILHSDVQGGQAVHVATTKVYTDLDQGSQYLPDSFRKISSECL
jgi:hypothetical protein